MNHATNNFDETARHIYYSTGSGLVMKKSDMAQETRAPNFNLRLDWVMRRTLDMDGQSRSDRTLTKA